MIGLPQRTDREGEATVPSRPRSARWRTLAASLPDWCRPSMGDLVLLSLFKLLLAVPPYDSDLWWHLATGNRILAGKAIPRLDPFSFTAAGSPWIAHEWLAEVGLALAWRAAGLEAMTVIQAALLTMVLAVAYFHMRSDEATLPLYVPTLVVTLVLLLPAAHPRPYLASLLALAILLYWLHVCRDRSWLVLAVPLLFGLWANTHAGFALGLAAMAASVAGEAWRTRRVPRRLLVLALLALAGSLANPHGARLLAYPLQYRAGSAHYDLITEWASPDFHQPYSWLVLGFLAATAILLTARRAPGWHSDGLLLALFGGLAMVSVRNIPLLGVVGAPILARQVMAGAPRLRAARRVPGWPGRPGGAAPVGQSAPMGTAGLLGGDAAIGGDPVVGGDPPRRASLARRVALDFERLWRAEAEWSGLPLTLVVVIAAVAVALGGPRDARAFDPSAWPRSRSWDLPYGAMEPLGDLAGEGRLLNDYSWGGYIIWALRSTRPVFIDGRADVYGDRILRDYAEMVSLGPGWRTRLDAYGIDRVLLPPATPLVQALELSDEWARKYADETSVLLVRLAAIGPGGSIPDR